MTISNSENVVDGAIIHQMNEQCHNRGIKRIRQRLKVVLTALRADDDRPRLQRGCILWLDGLEVLDGGVGAGLLDDYCCGMASAWTRRFV